MYPSIKFTQSKRKVCSEEQESKGSGRDGPAKGISFKEFRQRLQTEEAYETYLFRPLWPEVSPALKVEGLVANTPVWTPGICLQVLLLAKISHGI